MVYVNLGWGVPWGGVMASPFRGNFFDEAAKMRFGQTSGSHWEQNTPSTNPTTEADQNTFSPSSSASATDAIPHAGLQAGVDEMERKNTVIQEENERNTGKDGEQMNSGYATVEGAVVEIDVAMADITETDQKLEEFTAAVKTAVLMTKEEMRLHFKYSTQGSKKKFSFKGCRGDRRTKVSYRTTCVGISDTLMRCLIARINVFRCEYTNAYYAGQLCRGSHGRSERSRPCNRAYQSIRTRALCIGQSSSAGDEMISIRPGLTLT
jgi:hypothetical protein